MLRTTISYRVVRREDSYSDPKFVSNCLKIVLCTVEGRNKRRETESGRDRNVHGQDTVVAEGDGNHVHGVGDVSTGVVDEEGPPGLVIKSPFFPNGIVPSQGSLRLTGEGEIYQSGYRTGKRTGPGRTGRTVFKTYDLSGQ